MKPSSDKYDCNTVFPYSCYNQGAIRFPKPLQTSLAIDIQLKAKVKGCYCTFIRSITGVINHIPNNRIMCKVTGGKAFLGVSEPSYPPDLNNIGAVGYSFGNAVGYSFGYSYE